MKRIGIIGGSGLYDIEGFDSQERARVETPFGAPSDELLLGDLEGVPVAFLPRHGRGHTLSPTAIPYRANVYALKQTGCEAVISISAVGSMKEDIRPGDLVLVDQFIDRTRQRPSTFYDDGIAAHIPFAEPMCVEVRAALAQAAAEALADATVHVGGTYLCMEGPAFSTRAESLVYRSWGVSVIGMTNLQEAKLCREAEMHMQTVALATDYDCWYEGEASVNVEEVVRVMRANIGKAKRLLRAAVPRVAAALARDGRACPCDHALKGAIMTAPGALGAATRERLDLLIGRYL